MKSLFGFLVLLVSMGASAAIPAMPQAPRITLRFEKNIELNQNTKYSLADIAQIEGATRDQLDQLRQIDLTSVVSAETPVTPAKIVPALRKSLEERSLQASIVISSNVSFNIKSNYSIKHFERLIAPYLQAECGSNCVIEMQPGGGGHWNLNDWSIAEFPNNLQSSITVPIKIADSQSFRWMPFKVRAWKDVPVLIRTLNNGEVITAENIGSKKIDLAIRKNIFTEETQLVGHKVQGMVTAGSPIDTNRLAREYVIHRGQRAKAVVGDDVLEVSVPIEALQDGVKGDVIRVRQTDSRKEMQAKIIEAGIVRVE